MRSLRFLCLVLAAALLSTACGADEPSAPTGPLPFDQVLTELFGTNDIDAYLADTEDAASALLVRCMNDAGFDFQIEQELDTLDQPESGDLTAAQIDGFGIIAAFRHQLAQSEVTSALAPDPNIEYLGTLTAAEIQRFFVTLDGEEAEPGQVSSGGCRTRSTSLAYARWNRFFDVLPNFTVLGEERDTHPDWLAARSQWRECMIDRGFDYSEPDAIRNDVVSRMRSTVNESYAGGKLPMIERDGRLEVDPAVDTLLDELADFERGAAVANIECTEPLADEFDAVERLIQQAFVDRNRDTIDELLSSLN